MAATVQIVRKTGASGSIVATQLAMTAAATEPRRLVRLAADPRDTVVRKFAVAAALAAATAMLVPREAGWLRTLGYGTAVGFAVDGLAGILRVPRGTEEEA